MSLGSMVKMKGLGKRFGSGRKGERERLVSGESGSQNPSYIQSGTDRPRSSSGSEILSQQKQGIPMSPTAIRYNGQATRSRSSADSTSSLPPSPSSPSTSVEIEIDFDQVPFQFFRRRMDTWQMPLVQAVCIVLACLLIPSPVYLIGMLVKHIRAKYKPRKKKEAAKKELSVILFFLIVVITKDFVYIMLALHVYFASPASTYEVAYSPIVLTWFLFGFLLPSALFFFADPEYVFGPSASRKGSVFDSFPILSAQATTVQARKEEHLDKITNVRYKRLLGVTHSNDEPAYVMNVIPQWLLPTTFVTVLVICVAHCFIPVVFQIISCDVCRDSNVTHVLNRTTMINGTIFFNGTTVLNGTNSSLPVIAYRTVIALAGIDSLFVSLLISVVFVYTTFWKIAVYLEWLHFNRLEAKSNKTLITSGPSGIAVWWKIRQLLIFCTESNGCMSVLFGHITCGVATVLVVCSSIFVFFAAQQRSSADPRYLLLILIDNVLLCAALLIQGILMLLSNRQKAIAGDMLKLKQLNIAFELGRLMNLDQDTIQQEPQVRVSVRVLRGCLMLLQELTPTLDKSGLQVATIIKLGYVAISLVLVVASTCIGSEYVSRSIDKF